MAFLFSKHDYYHVHALNGFLVLLHFLYRLVLFARFKNSFVNPNVFTACSILMHGLLHISSFQFSLPRKRIMSRPLIWTEFRLHSAIFGFRHIVATLLTLYAPRWWTMYGGNVLVVVAANEAAAYVTSRYGSTTKRTTNSMAYPTGTDSKDIAATKEFYTNMQFSATTVCIYGPPSITFIPLLGIQGAAFLMTLGRKGILSTAWYHRLYTACLFTPLLMYTYVVRDLMLHHPMQCHLLTLMFLTSKHIRMYFRGRASVHWAGMVAMSQVVVRLVPGLFSYVHHPLLVLGNLFTVVARYIYRLRWMAKSGNLMW